MTFNNLLLPPGYLKEIAAERREHNFLGMRVFESPLAFQQVPDGATLKHAWDQNNGQHYVLEPKFKRMPVAIMFDSRVLGIDFMEPMPAIRLRDLTTFSDPTAYIAALYA